MITSEEKSEKKEPRKTPKKTELVLKGLREVPTPKDKHGCGHCGVFDLKTLSRDDLKYYTKKGHGWRINLALIVRKRNQAMKRR